MRHPMTRLLATICAVAVATSLWAPHAQAEEAKQLHPNLAKAAGKVAEVSGNTFTLDTRHRGLIKVQHDANTRWRNLSAGDIKVGVSVAAIGKLTGEVLHAEAIGTLQKKMRGQERKTRFPKRPARGQLLKGEITAVGDSTFTLQTRRRKMEVSFNDDTVFRGGSAQSIKRGAKVGVVPVRPKDGDLRSFRKSPKVTAKVIAFPTDREHRAKRSKGRQGKGPY